MARLTGTLLLLSTLSGALPAQAQPDPATTRESTVQIAVMDDTNIRRAGSGFPIAENYVLTAAHLVANEDRIVAVPLTTGAELFARVVYANDRADLALLAVNGLALPPLLLASDGFDPGQSVYSVGVWNPSGEPPAVATAEDDVPVAIAEGSVGRHTELPGSDEVLAVLLLEHNAMILAPGYGGALLNECGEVAGLNRGSPGVSARRLRRGQAPEGVVHALRAPAIAALLEAQGFETATSDTPCVGALAAARTAAEEAATDLEQSRQELQDAADQAKQTREQLERTQQEREHAAGRAAEAKARVDELETQYQAAIEAGDEQAVQAQSLQAELETALADQDEARAAVDALEGELEALGERLQLEAAADRQRLIVIAGLAGGAVLAIAVIAFVVTRRRSRLLALARAEAAQAQQAAADAQGATSEAEAAFADCVLTGTSGDGHPVSVKVPGELLGGEGAVIGRSPRNSTLLVDDRTLSREHARLFAEDDALYIEDLASTNGTRVNDQPIAPRTPTSLVRGDTLQLGAVKLELLRPD